MLNKGLKSEEDRRIEAIVEKLSAIGFVPDNEEAIASLNEELKGIGLAVVTLEGMSGEEIGVHLKRFNFSWEQMEAFGDLLATWSSTQVSFKFKAKELYEYIQRESKSFSFDRMQKISRLS